MKIWICPCGEEFSARHLAQMRRFGHLLCPKCRQPFGNAIADIEKSLYSFDPYCAVYTCPQCGWHNKWRYFSARPLKGGWQFCPMCNQGPIPPLPTKLPLEGPWTLFEKKISVHLLSTWELTYDQLMNFLDVWWERFPNVPVISKQIREILVEQIDWEGSTHRLTGILRKLDPDTIIPYHLSLDVKYDVHIHVWTLQKEKE